MKKFIYAFTAIALLLLSCSREEELQKMKYYKYNGWYALGRVQNRFSSFIDDLQVSYYNHSSFLERFLLEKVKKISGS